MLEPDHKGSKRSELQEGLKSEINPTSLREVVASGTWRTGGDDITQTLLLSTPAWKHRIGGDYSSSPILAGGHIYFASHDGKVTVLRPGRDGEIVSENQIAGQIMATPAVIDKALILRTKKAIYRIE